MSQTIRIAHLNTDLPLGAALPKYGTYGNIFHGLISSAATRISSKINVVSANYDVTSGEYPPILEEVDLLLVTGSAASAYDNEEWIKTLEIYIRHIYKQHPKIKIFGSCFGHQLICQSLLKEYGVIVEKDPNGYELGVQEIILNDQFRKSLGSTAKILDEKLDAVLVSERLRQQMIHTDHVKVPSASGLPKSWMSIGRTEHCAIQGVYQHGRVLTFQGHFEFDRFINGEVLKVFGAKWDPAVYQKAFEAIDADDDADVAAEIVVRFLLETTMGSNVVTREVVGGMLTPPIGA